ncbi:hypothetical protein D3C72_1795210 [compost metagenome]
MASRSSASNSRDTLLRVVPTVSNRVMVLKVDFSNWILKRSNSARCNSSAL